MPTTRAAQSRSSIYPVGDGFLLVPTVEMWNIHEASKPSAILARAGLGRAHWRLWLQRPGPWIVDWLYSYRDPTSKADGFEPSDAMLAFKREASIRAILAAAPRSRQQMQEAWRDDRKEHVTDSLLSHWRRMYAAHPWFDRWLLRGEDAPPNVTIATAQQVGRCKRAWDFSAFCQRADIDLGSTYVLWLSRRQIPSQDWLKWLYGGPPPAGSFVVEQGLQCLRREMGQKALLRGAGLSETAIWQWEKDPQTRGAIRAILEAADPANLEGWEQLPQGARDRMLLVREAATLAACCKRANISVRTYYAAMAEAQRLDVKDELTQYLKMQGRYAPLMLRQSGLVAENFFIPTTGMSRFRDEAIREGAQQKITSLQNLPGFDAWFRDWTAPKAHRGRRHTLPSGVTPPRTMDGQGGGGDLSPAKLPASDEVARPRRSLGRRRSEETAEVYAFCYDELRLKGKKASVVLRLAIARFGNARAPKEVSKVYDCARRHEHRLRKEATTKC